MPRGSKRSLNGMVVVMRIASRAARTARADAGYDIGPVDEEREDIESGLHRGSRSSPTRGWAVLPSCSSEIRAGWEHHPATMRFTPSPSARVSVSDSEERSESKQLLVAKINPIVAHIARCAAQFLEHCPFTGTSFC